ncbi:MAG: DUF89 family protein [Crenarchaeota archaeon]|nr:DUF89 family protein [Thermoproteota archaeon]
MKFKTRCIPCQVEVRYRDVIKLFSDEDRRYRYMMDIVKMLHDLARENRDPAPVVATKMFRFLKIGSGVDDPYRFEKHIANMEGLKLLESLEEHLENMETDMRKMDLLSRLVLLGNSIDLGVAGYRPPSVTDLIREIESMNVKGRLPMFYKKRIVYLLDNAGEAVLDRLLARELQRLENEVIAVVKGGAFQNDITVNEVAEAGLDQDFSDVVSTGTDAASIFLDEIDKELVDIIRDCDIIIAKGMAHYEYITEVEDRLSVPIVYMMKAKCEPIAEATGVEKGSYVILRRGI